MKKFLCGLVMLPFISATAMAQPTQLSENQMDTVSAGWDLTEIELSNTSLTIVAVYHDGVPTTVPGFQEFLHISSPAISISSFFRL
ncbi:MAG TPA: hypothetical protein VIR81_07485 [Myxococcales bacterium]